MKFFTFIAVAFCGLLPGRALAAIYDVNAGDRAFLRDVLAAVERKDATWIGVHSLLPMAVTEDGKTRVIEKEELVRLVKHSLTDAFSARFHSEAQKPLFKNWRGVMVGDGILWFEQIKRHDNDPWTFAILAFGGFAFQPSNFPEGSEELKKPARAQ